MSGKWPDTRLRAALADVNLEFLQLVRQRARVPGSFGLEESVRLGISELDMARCVLLSRTPCLLAGFGHALMAGSADHVADTPSSVVPLPVEAPTQLYAATLLTWLWQVVRDDALLATLCLGPDPLAAEGLRARDFRELQHFTPRAAHALEARFAHHPRFWPDLLRAVRQGEGELLHMTQLAAVQLTLVGLRTPAQTGAHGGRLYEARLPGP